MRIDIFPTGGVAGGVYGAGIPLDDRGQNMTEFITIWKPETAKSDNISGVIFPCNSLIFRALSG